MPRILVIDDEPGVVRFVRRALESTGHTVAHAHDGATGLRLGLETQPDLVVLDLVMPGLSGIGVLGALTAERPAVKVIVVSADGDVATRVRCLEAGAVDYLTKPFALSELLARIHLRLREPAPDRLDVSAPSGPARRDAPAGPGWRGSGHDALRVGDVRLDRRSRVLYCAGTGIELSPREFVLIQHLMEHAGDVCTRAELLSEVWGYAFDPGSNVVDVTVARLRSKIKGLRIETVRNVGYALRQA